MTIAFRSQPWFTADMITKRQLLLHYKTQTAIALLLGITKQAVCNWDLDAPIPALQEKRLRYELAPTLFGVARELKLEA